MNVSTLTLVVFSWNH